MKHHFKKFALVFSIIILLFGVGVWAVNISYGYNELTLLSDSEEVVQSDSISGSCISAVTSLKGNCYIRGDSFTEDENFGVENVAQFNNRFNRLSVFNCHPSYIEDSFVLIYDGNDAHKIKLSQYGGTIITQNDDVYLFVNRNEAFRVPTFLCTGYIDAYLFDSETVFLIAKNGDWGYIFVDSPSDFHSLGHNVKKFKLEEMSGLWYILTNNNTLYKMNSTVGTPELLTCLEGVLDFDICFLEYNRVNKTSFAYIDESHKPHYCCENGEITIEQMRSAPELNYNTEAVSVASYGKGIVVLDNNGYTSAFGKSISLFDDETLFENQLLKKGINCISASEFQLSLIDKNGKLFYYGELPSNQWIGFDDI